MIFKTFIWIIFVMTAVALCVGCVRDDAYIVENQEEQKVVSNVFVRLNISAGSPQPKAADQTAPQTKAGLTTLQTKSVDTTAPQTKSGLTTPGTSSENAVTTIDLLVFDAGKNSLINIISLNDRIEELQTSAGAVIAISAEENSRVRVCAVANLPSWMRSRLIVGQPGDIYFVSNKPDFREVMNDFVPGSNGTHDGLMYVANGSVPMTGIFKDNSGNEILTVSEDRMSEANPLVLKADMARLVSKIHVLAKPSADVSQQGYADCRIGWIKLDDIRYQLNAINKSSYLFPQSSENSLLPLWKDLNMDLTVYAIPGSEKFDEFLWSRDFVFYRGLSLHKDNVSDDSRFEAAEIYDEVRLEKTASGENDPQRYVGGMYCLENYFDVPTSDERAYSSLKEAIPMVTHVAVAARLIPDKIVLPLDFADRMDAFVAEYKNDKVKFRQTYSLSEADFDDAQVARWENLRYTDFYGTSVDVFGNLFLYSTTKEENITDILTWSLMYNKIYSSRPEDFERGKYSVGTFYCYDTDYGKDFLPAFLQDEKYIFLSVGAVAAASGQYEAFATYSVQHVGGWGYYYAYPDETGETTDGVAPYRCAQVTRNNYYLLTVSSISSPGGTVTKPEYIKLKTTSADWDYVAKGNVQLH